MVFLDQPGEILVLSCVLRLGGRREAAFEASGGDRRAVSQQRASVSPCMRSVTPRDSFLARKPRERSNPRNRFPNVSHATPLACKKEQTREITSPPKPNFSMKTTMLLSALLPAPGAAQHHPRARLHPRRRTLAQRQLRGHFGHRLLPAASTGTWWIRSASSRLLSLGWRRKIIHF